MKKILSLVLALALVLSCTAALADLELTVVDLNDDRKEVLVAGTGIIDKSTVVGDAYLNAYYTVPAALADKNLVSEEPKMAIYRLSMVSHGREEEAPVWQSADIKTDSESVYYNDVMDFTIEGSEVPYELVATWTYINDEGKKVDYVESVKFYVNAVDTTRTIISSASWYQNNHAHAFGPKLADSWKTYAALDLSKDGTTTLKLIAAGAWDIGTITVTVNGDEVVVNYLMHEDIKKSDVNDDIKVEAEYLNFFADVAAIDPKAESTFAYGVPFSIANDLGGATTVAMFTELTVDYPSTSPFVYRFWPNLKENYNIVKAMCELLGIDAPAAAKYNGTVPSPDAGYVPSPVPSPDADKVPSPVA